MTDKPKNPAAQALGRLGKGKKKTMSPAAIEQRKKAASKPRKQGEVSRSTIYRRKKKAEKQ